MILNEPSMNTVAVVGASLAGLGAIEELRRREFSGRIVVIDAERSPLYDRPPLSKQFLAGEREPSRVALRTAEHLESLELDLRFGRAAVGLDLDKRTLWVDGGDPIGFDGLVLATGAQPRKLPHTPDRDGLFTLRSLDDSVRLRMAITVPGARVVIVGGGFLGMEVAATACRLGANVSIVEALSAPLERVLPSELGAVLGRLHASNGVSLYMGSQVARVLGDERVEGVVLDSGERIVADVVLVAIGAIPVTDWLSGSDLEVSDGVVVDETLSAAPQVMATGDIARFPHPLAGESVRLEHWTNAVEHGAHAAANLLCPTGEQEPFSSVPYFWSDHFDLKIQALGLPGPHDDVRIVSGNPNDCRFLAACGRNGRLVGVVGFGRSREVMSYRPLLERGAAFGETP
jgi:3-phenylpropionate/trans-cinnamate dioxygenase ferredoxin reductase subunit